MEVFNNPPQSTWDALCRRPSADNPVVTERVKVILARVKEQGDEALRQLSLEIEGRALKAIEVPEVFIRQADAKVSPKVKQAICQAMKNIQAFHEAQQPREIRVETAPGVTCIQRPVPIGRVGLYIPGGSAPLFSTVLMLAIPARIAGCQEVILCTPAGKNGAISPEVLYTASLCGIRRLFQLGGAQAIAAMAYGTESVPRVDKIFGPGNAYVTTAKQLLSADTVAIDMPAGPSEVMVLADSTTPPAFAAADLLSQAVLKEVERQTAQLPRSAIALQALGKSHSVILPSLDNRIAFANLYAPEHLIISTRDPWAIANRITAAGSVFVGPYTPESAGDYASGTNHTLPTSGWARSFSGVNLDSFYRKMTLQEITREGLQGLSKTIVDMSRAEGLQAHANAVKVRTDE